MEKGIQFCVSMGLLLMYGYADEILLRKTKTRLDLMEHSLALWSGVAKSLAWCGFLCAGEPNCVSLLYDKTEKFCMIFNLLHQVEESTEEINYYVIVRASNRKLPESCAEVANSVGTHTDGEYWLYPKATHGQRVKVYCHNMGTNPTEYITLKYANTFVYHTCSNWVLSGVQCQTTYKPPLKTANFNKIAIHIQDMTLNRTDYTFAALTGNFGLRFGETTDCNGHGSRLDCHFFGDAVINTRGTGIILDQNIQWGVIKRYYTSILDFTRSMDGSEISFKCGGWWGKCGAKSGDLKIVLASEFVPDTEAKSEVCLA